MYNKQSNTRILITVAIITALVLSAIGARYWITSIINTIPHEPSHNKQEWMTVFVHGSFATTLGLISVFNVIKDKVHKTNYKKMTRLMRKDPFFYQMQPLQELGLKPLEPTFDPKGLTHKYAAFPIAAAYETLSALAHNEKEKNYFYTFGWSGLVSQYRRRKEAIKLYSALVTEYAALKARGINPKIRLIAHSHGGNLILNMAGIHELLQKGIENEPSADRYPDADQLTSMKEIHKLLQAPLPDIAPFHIDELLMFGTPIQPETLSFCLSPFFKKIYNIYSDDDIIQSMDWVSTRRYYSEKRIALTPITTEQPVIVQIKITLNKPTQNKESQQTAQRIRHVAAEATEIKEALPEESNQAKAMGTLKDTINTIWARVFGTRQSKTALDPLHKEFWFMGWKSRDQQILAQQHIQPYPYVILTPYIQKLVNKLPDAHDLDIVLKFGKETISLSAYTHNTTEKRRKIYINTAILKELQRYAQAWQPENITPSYEMELLHQYSQMLNS